VPRPRTLQGYRIAASRQVSGLQSRTPARGFRFSTALLVALAVHAVLMAGLMTVRIARAEPVLRWRTFAAQVAPPPPAGSPVPPLPPPAVSLPVPTMPTVDLSLPALPPVIAAVATETARFTDPVWTWPSTNLLAGTGTGSGGAGGETNGVIGGVEGGTGTGPVVPPNYQRPPQPRYPAQARQQGWEGTAVLRVEVRADGAPGAVLVLQSSGHPVLDDAAVVAVRGARFQVGQTAWVEVPITFRLNRS
jgi:protein TonB